MSGTLFPTDEQRVRDDDLRLEPVVRHDVAPGEEVVQLVGASDLDVRLDRHRVVRLHRRVQQLGQRDRLAGGEPLREVVALEQPRHRQRPRQPHRLGERERREPLPVEPELGPPRIEDAYDLLAKALRVRIQLVVGEDGPLGRAPGRVADTRGVVPDDEHDRVTGVLPLAQPVEDDREPEVDVGRGRVDTELHPQRSACLELLLEPIRRENMDGVAGGGERLHGRPSLVIR